MKKRSGSVSEHNLSQARHMQPESDLGAVNAYPQEFVPDVDFAPPCVHGDVCTCGHHGHHYEWEEGHGGHMGQHSFAVEKRAKKWEI